MIIKPWEIEQGKVLLGCLDARPLTLASLRKTMLILTRFHWSRPENHGPLADNFEGLTFDMDRPDTSYLPIEPLESYSEEKSHCPAIYTGQRESPLKPMSMGANYGNFSPSEDNSTSVHGWRCETTMVAGCMHTSIEVAQLMAESTLTFWSGIGSSLCSRLGLLSFQPLGMSPPVKQDKAPTRSYRVDVTAQIVFTWAVSVNIESHRLKLIMSEINPTPDLP